MMEVWDRTRESVAGSAPEPALAANTERRVLVVNSNVDEQRLVCEQVKTGIVHSLAYGVASREEALAKIDELELDCVLFTEASRGDCGLNMIAEFTDRTTLRRIPVIVLGETGSATDKTRALEAGAVDYLDSDTATNEFICSSISNAISHDRLNKIIDLQNRQIQALGKERTKYVRRTDELAHELLTPLAGIQEFVSLVFDGVSGPINEQQARHLAYARGGCTSIRTTVDSLLVDRDLERIFAK